MQNNIAVNVAVRVRPLLSHENTNVIKYIQENGEPPVLIVGKKRNAYAFDHVFTENVQQTEVYNVMAKPLVSQVLLGYNCSILAYGQTGTGKTYTMGTDSQKYHDLDSGIIPRVLEEFLEISNQDPNISISISFIEIYNDKVFDLLRPSKTALIVKGFSVNGMTCVPVTRNEEARHWLLVGGKGRHVRHTSLNASSSRSHAIFTVYSTKIDSGVTSKLHLVDLAGSESVKKTGNRGAAMLEGITINRGLLAVGRVISALSNKNTPVIPYRDSILTTILHDSLTINNFVSLLACISPNETDTSQTRETLRFAINAKSVKSRPQLEAIIDKFDKINPGVLELNTCPTTAKKRKRRPNIFNFENDSLGSMTTLDSLSILSSTTIDQQQQIPISLLFQGSTEVLENHIFNSVNNTINVKNYDTPALSHKNEDKENLPPLTVYSTPIESQVREIIRNELSVLIGNGTILNQTKTTASAIKKKLNFDSPSCTELQNFNPESLVENSNDQTFKVPIHRAIKRKTKDSSDTSPYKIRKSLRLSLKPQNLKDPVPTPRHESLKFCSNSLGNQFSPQFKPTRRSLRLSMKCINSPKIYSALPTPKPRNSVRIVDKSLLPTPAPRKLKRPIENIEIKCKSPKKTTDSPRTRHRNKTLKLLNYGTQKDLQSLSTIGIKTSLQIVTYRCLSGEIKIFEDLKKMLLWGDKQFEKFMRTNHLL